MFVYKMLNVVQAVKTLLAECKDSSRKKKYAPQISHIMLLKLDVLSSTTIKRKKPWPTLSWLGKVSLEWKIIQTLFYCAVLLLEFSIPQKTLREKLNLLNDWFKSKTMPFINIYFLPARAEFSITKLILIESHCKLKRRQ